MPDYKFTDPATNLTIKVTGPAPPSEAILKQLFAQAAKAAPPPSTDTTAAEPNPAHIGAVAGGDTAPVTLGDLIDNPSLAIKRMVSITKQALTDPKVMVPVAGSLLVGGLMKAADVAPEMPGMGLPKRVGTALRDNISAQDLVDMAPKPVQAAGRVAMGLKNAAQQILRPTPSTPVEPAPAPPAAAVPPPVAQTPVPAPAPVVEPPAAAQTAPESVPAPRAAKGSATKPAGAEMPSLEDLHLTPAEITQAVKWHENGVSPEMILHRILKSRQLTAKLRTDTPDQAAEAVRQRNATGKWQ